MIDPCFVTSAHVALGDLVCLDSMAGARSSFDDTSVRHHFAAMDERRGLVVVDLGFARSLIMSGAGCAGGLLRVIRGVRLPVRGRGIERAERRDALWLGSRAGGDLDRLRDPVEASRPVGA